MDLPHEDDEAQHPIADAYRDHLKHTPNSWAMPQIKAAEPPFEPHCQALIPIPPPKMPWLLSHNDKRFLLSLRIDPTK